MKHKLQTIDEYCNQPKGSFKKFIMIEEKRIKKIEDARRIVNSSKSGIKSKPHKCGCYLHKNQVCNICQKVTDKEKDINTKYDFAAEELYNIWNESCMWSSVNRPENWKNLHSHTQEKWRALESFINYYK